jgi:dihydroorotase
MKILLKNLKIVDSNSKHHLSVKDILIEKGIIKKIGSNLEPDGAKVISHENASVSVGWVDMNCHIFEPGLEYREDIESGLKAATNGGFTSVCFMPNTNPPIDTKGQIEYLKNAGKGYFTQIIPIGAVSKNIEGKDLAEIYDMQSSGAVAFSDGLKSIQNSGLLERALLYVKKFDGLVLNQPNDEQIAHGGNMNEGIMSTQLGLHAAPKLAEELMVSRDIYLAEDTNSRLHFTSVSTKKSVELIRQAKAKGLKVTAAVNAYNLLLDDSYLHDFDTNFKAIPHVRNQEDIDALLEGLSDGTIDAICSGHTPLHIDEKKVEFDNAEFGISSIDIAFSIAAKATENKLTHEQLIEKFSSSPYSILKLNRTTIEENQNAILTVYNSDMGFEVSSTDILSKGKNCPFVGMQLKGKVLGIVQLDKTNLK